MPQKSEGLTDEEVRAIMEGKSPDEVISQSGLSDEDIVKKFAGLTNQLGPKLKPHEIEKTGAKGFATGAFKQGGLDLLTLGQGVRQAIPSPFREAISPDPAQNIARAQYRGYSPGGEFSLFDRNGRFQREMGYLPRGQAEELGAEGMKLAEGLIGPRGALRVPLFGPRKPGAVTQLTKGLTRVGIPEVAARAGSEGAWQGLVSAIQGDEPGKAAGWGAGVSAATDLTLGRFGRFASPILEEKAIRDYGRMFDPKTIRETARARQAAEFMYGQEEGALTRGQLHRKSQRKIESLLPEKFAIENAWGPRGRIERWMDLDEINDSIERARNRMRVTNPVTGQSAWKDTTFGQHTSDVLDRIKKGLADVGIQQRLPNGQVKTLINYANAEDIKRDMQVFLDKFGRFAEKSKGKDIATAADQLARDIAYRALMRQFAKEVPDVAAINATIAHWLTVRNSISGIHEKSFGRQKKRLGGVIMPGSQGNMAQRITKSGQYGFTVGLLNSLLNTPAWLTMTAKTKGMLARQLSQGSVEGLRALMSTVAAQTQSDPRLPKSPFSSVSESSLPPPGRHIWTPGGYVPADPTDRITTGTAEEEMFKSAPKTGESFATPGGGRYLRDPNAPFGWREEPR
jgi:hypothetical protein